jgi:monoamine oxidase
MGFKKGFQQVPLTVADLVKKAGGNLEFGARLQTFAWDSERRVFTLSIKGRDPVTAKTVILAMPRRALELIESPLLADNRVQGLIKSVTPRPLFKLFTTYSNPWWTAAGVEAGRTVTDLPVRQTYYWPTNEGKPATSGRAMLMASYDDGTNIGYWDGYRERRGKTWRATASLERTHAEFAGPDDADGEETAWDQHPAPARMVEEAARQLALVHGLSYTPAVLSAAFRDWGDDPFGGGWNSWNIGVQSWKVKHEITEPYAGEAPLYICGEAYSDAQGWVEGALQTADFVLEKFGIGPLPVPLTPPRPVPLTPVNHGKAD